MTFGYDIVYKLLNETIASDPVPASNGAIGYSHDGVGNRVTRTSTVAAIAPSSATFDANDRISGNTFDNDGNTLTSGGNSYSYDFLDRLTSLNGSAVTMVYDGDGNRVAKTVGGVTTKYLIDDRNPTGYTQVVEELVSGAVQRRYTHGLMRISQSQLISSSWVTNYYGYDGSGSVRQLFDAFGAVTDRYVYDAFGNTVAITGTTPNTYLYRGEQFDASLQLYYLRARWMNPQTGRFLTMDSYEGEDLPSAPDITTGCCGLQRNRWNHLYNYAAGDPVNGIDPTGHNLVDQTILIGYGVIRFAPWVVAGRVVASPLFIGVVSPFCKFFLQFREELKLLRVVGIPAWLLNILNTTCAGLGPFL